VVLGGVPQVVVLTGERVGGVELQDRGALAGPAQQRRGDLRETCSVEVLAHTADHSGSALEELLLLGVVTQEVP
jgi:hypothetical protein